MKERDGEGAAKKGKLHNGKGSSEQSGNKTCAACGKCLTFYDVI